MTNDELKQLVESNARAIQGNSETIKALGQTVRTLGETFEAEMAALATSGRRLDAKLDRLADIVQGNYRRIVSAETGAMNNESAWLDAMAKIDQLEQRLAALEGNLNE